MNLEMLRNFIAIVQAGNLTGASERIHIAQPTLSRQLRQLETYYDAKLVLTERGSRQLALTDAGRLLFEKAQYICSLDDSAREEIHGAEMGAAGTLRLSVANSRAKPLVTRMLKGFGKAYPNVNFMIFESSSLEQRQQLLSGVGELGLLSTPPDRNSEIEELFRTDEFFAAVFHKDSAFLREPERKGIELAGLKDVPISISSGYYQEFNRCCAKMGFAPHIRSLSTTRSTAFHWAEADVAVAVMPMSEGEEMSGELVVKKILDTDIEIYKSVVKVKGRPLSPLALKFVDYYNENGNARRLCDIRRLYEESRRDRHT